MNERKGSRDGLKFTGSKQGPHDGTGGFTR